MQQKQIPKIGYLTSCYDTKMQPLDAQKLDELMKSERVRMTMHQIETSNDEEQKSELKKQLPAILFQCLMPLDGHRPTTATAQPSGLCMHDWDHMPLEPRTYYLMHIAGRERELGIVMAHVTPRGHGLRLVTTLHDGEQPVQCQRRLAALFHMEAYADEKVRDLTRLSFLPSDDYQMYLDSERLFYVDNGSTSQQVNETTSLISNTESPCPFGGRVGEGASSVADAISYEGIKFSAIIDTMLQRIASNGQPVEGERNDDLFLLARELRHITNYNFQMLHMLLSPYFPALNDGEVRRTIHSAITTNGRTITPTLRGVIDELKHQDINVDEQLDATALPRVPRLSAVEEMILSKYPKYLRSQAYMSMLPIWGVYGTHLRFDYLDGRENSLSFMTAVVGKSGSGKGFASQLFDLMTKRFREEDAQERRKADEYLAVVNKMGDSEEKPDDPRPRVRLYGDDITTSQFLEYLDNLGGEHGLQFTEEVARLQKAKRTAYGDNDDLYCKAFDNAIGGKESKSKLTRNIRIPIYLNTLFCGTPGAMHKFYSNPEGGLNNRIIYAFMPRNHAKGFPHYGKLTEAEQQQFDEVCDRLWQAGQDGKKVELPWLNKTICSIKNRWDREDEENPNEVWYDLGKRAMVVAFRVGVLQWHLRGCPTDEKQLREICKVVRWMADAMRQCVYAFSGKDYEQIAEADNLYQQQSASRMGKNKKLFSLLPTDFTIQDVIQLRVKNGDSASVYTVLHRWAQDGLILSDRKGHYHKVTSSVGEQVA